jgi:hypothetical protein
MSRPQPWGTQTYGCRLVIASTPVDLGWFQQRGQRRDPTRHRCGLREIVTTASPRNFDYVRKLGASQVFDYNDANVVATMVKSLSHRDMTGALAIAAGSRASCIEIMSPCHGQRTVSMPSSPCRSTMRR